MEQLYQRRGYRGTIVGLSTADKDGAVSASYSVQEGELTRIGQITISGLTATKPYVVERELQFEPGEPLTAVTLSEARRRLDATRLFDRVDVEPLGDPNAPIRDVQVVVREAKPWRFEFGAGYDTDDGFRGFVTLGYDNLFGTGRSASVRQRISQKGSRSEVNYREPWVFGSSWMGEALLFRDRTQEIGYISDSFGSTLTVERELLHKPLPARGADGSPQEPARRVPVPGAGVPPRGHRSRSHRRRQYPGTGRSRHERDVLSHARASRPAVAIHGTAAITSPGSRSEARRSAAPSTS